jgi:hypothetical protein
MYHRFHDRFGTAGVVIAVIALVAALGGTALAAGGLNAKQKKEVKAIAKGFQGTGPAGPQGLPGASGTNGKAGAQGEKGATGEKGAKGDTGTTGAQGPQGAKGDTGAAGPEGSPWTAGGTLPGGETETGLWATPPVTDAGGTAFVSASFTIPLATAPEESSFHLLAQGASPTAECPGSFADPKAASGQFCAYTGLDSHDSLLGGTLYKAGAVLTYSLEDHESFAFGSWAVTAPTTP